MSFHYKRPKPKKTLGIYNQAWQKTGLFFLFTVLGLNPYGFTLMHHIIEMQNNQHDRWWWPSWASWLEGIKATASAIAGGGLAFTLVRLGLGWPGAIVGVVVGVVGVWQIDAAAGDRR